MHDALPAKSPTEAKVVTFDFSTAPLVLPITLIGISKSTIVGSDPSAAGLVVGAGSISGSTILTLVAGGLEDCSYLLTCTISDFDSQVHQIGATLTTTTAAI